MPLTAATKKGIKYRTFAQMKYKKDVDDTKKRRQVQDLNLRGRNHMIS
jgi:hypothetical protein